MMNNSLRWTVLGVALMAGTSMVLAQQQPPAAQPAPQQPTTVGITLTGEGGAQTRLAVPDLGAPRVSAVQATGPNSASVAAEPPASGGNLVRYNFTAAPVPDRKSTRLNSSHSQQSRMPSSA